MADAEEVTRRLAAIMENKAARLEVLLERAEKQAEALEAAVRRAEGAGGVGPGAGGGEAEPPAALAMDPVHRRVYELADRGMRPVEIARELERPTGQVELILSLRRA